MSAYLLHLSPIRVVVNRIVGSMDVSGDQEFGNHKYLGIFMATQDGVGGIFSKLRRMNIRMNDLKQKRRRHSIIGRINFDGNQSIALCFRIDRNPIMCRTKQMRRLRNTSEGKILKTYHSILFHRLKGKMENFAFTYSMTLADVPFQCDSDCRNFIRDVGLKSELEGDAHVFADLIAWANNTGTEPRGVCSLDLVSVLQDNLIRQLIK